MKKHSFLGGLLTLILVLSMILTSTVLLTVATDDVEPQAVAGDSPINAESERIPGDVSGNGHVDLLDLLILRRYFADFDFDAGVTMDIEGGDFNEDGKLDMTDILELRQYLANEDLGEGEDPDQPIDNVSAISPAVGSTVVLANDTVYSWYQKFDGTSLTVPPVSHQDLYYPVPVTFEWACREEADYYLVYISTDENMEDAISFVTNCTDLQIENLFVGTKYYWQVDAVCGNETLRSKVFTFTTANSPRTVNVEGVSNFRDIGGFPAGDGYRIKQGMIYRGAKLENITEKGKNTFLYELGIKTDYDLRTPGEGGAGVKSPISDSLKYYNFDGRYYCGSKGITTEENKKIVADEVRVFADPDNYPVYIHCSLGRDRTGTIVFILQALCGVGKNDLYADYEMSMFSVAGTTDNANPWADIQGVRSYINGYDGATFAEKTENYLLSCGITAEEIASIRSILIEEVE